MRRLSQPVALARGWLHARTEPAVGPRARLARRLRRLNFEQVGAEEWRDPVAGTVFRLVGNASRLGDEGMVIVTAGPDERYAFYCGWTGELSRAARMMTAEPGTVAWLQSCVREGDVVYDVGANIGVYSLLAARRVGQGGHVYAFEPHAGNVQSLLRNVAANDVRDRITVLSCALDERTGFRSFGYDDLAPGAGLSRLGTEWRQTGDGKAAPACAELKFSTSIDALTADGVIRAPDVVKIDVEGNELGVLKGMERALGSEQARPRTVQIEVDASTRPAVLTRMTGHGYSLSEEHLSEVGRRLRKRGTEPEKLMQNAVFLAG